MASSENRRAFAELSSKALRRKRPLLRVSESNPRYFAAVEREKLRIFEFQGHRRWQRPSLKVNIKTLDVLCLEWATSAGSVSRLGIGTQNDAMIATFPEHDFIRHNIVKFRPKYPRPCISVAWNRVNPTLVAAGFDKARDHCLQIWDVEYSCSSSAPAPLHVTSHEEVDDDDQQSHQTYAISPLLRFAHSNTCASIEWLHMQRQSMCLAAGLEDGLLRIYDIRVGSKNAVLAKTHRRARVHSDGTLIRSVKSNPTQPHLLATFGDDDRVMIWDIRKLKQSVAEICCNRGTTTQISWVPSDNGSSKSILATLSLREAVLKLWDVEAVASCPDRRSESPMYRRYFSRPIACIDWCHGASPMRSAPNSSKTRERSKGTDTYEGSGYKAMHDLITVNWDFTISVRPLMPTSSLAMSPKGEVCRIESSAREANITAGGQNQAARRIPSIAALNDDDIGTRMKRMASAGYGLDARSNVAILRRENLETCRKIAAVWSWVNRLQQGTSAKSDNDAASKQLRPVSLLKSGVRQRLFGGGSKQWSAISSFAVSKWCAFNVYQSDEREVAVRSCGWTTVRAVYDRNSKARRIRPNRTASLSTDLAAIMNAAEREEAFGRSAAIALFHCEIEAATAALQRAIAHVRAGERKEISSELTTGDVDRPSSYLYSLVLMVVVGYASNLTTVRRLSSKADVKSGSKRDSQDSAHTSARSGNEHVVALELWRSQRLDAISQLAFFPYLQAICLFLQLPSHIAFEDDGDGGSNGEVDAGMLGVHAVLRQQRMDAADSIAFACRFLPDASLRTTFETFATAWQSEIEGVILSGLGDAGMSILQHYLDRTGDVQSVALLRAQLSTDEVPENDVGSSWLDEYRALLNRWQLWKERAKLDVALANARRRDNSEAKSETYLREKCHVYPSCTHCGYSLYMPSQSSNGMEWLAREKSEMRRCPSCKKSLPRCSVCLGVLGTPNPYIRSRSPSGILSFDDWWVWCRHCGHGGHAGHLNAWFDRNRECPVVDCDCKCSLRGRPRKGTGENFRRK
eukprot:g2485.t1